MKKLYKPLLAIFILAMVYIALKGCGKGKPIINNSIKDTIAVNNLDLNIALANNKDLRIELDSIKKLKPIFKDRWYKDYDTIYSEAPDTCHLYLARLNAKCMVLDSINESVISSYASVIESDLQVFAKYEKLNNSRIKQSVKDSLVIDSLTHSKKKYFKGLKHGIIIGAIITQGLNTGSQFIK